MSSAQYRIPYLLVDAFTAIPGGGNRVALVLDARGMSTEEMQLVATKLGQPQAAFVTDWDGTGFGVRFFAANGEVEFSGHAAVALVVTLAREEKLPAGVKKIYLRTIGESLSAELEDSRARVQSPSPRFRDPPSWKVLQEFIELMGANERYLHRGLPYGITFTGLWTLFMPVVAPGLVDALEPDMEKLAELSSKLEVAAVHVYAPYGPRRFYARTFAPALGIPEDPVTGSPNAALGALLARAGVVPRWEGEVNLTVTQGHRMGGPGQVDVRVEYGPAGNILGVFIGGTAVVAENGVVELGGSLN
ncbi:PhzF family phenazine biosynthesis protein [Meiothermus sp.]|uniref:PhzF family phenazine biosynthesis protein n=1 Tax=Meiothermus sp. TaxID=1955249 RepID=UPI0021DEAA05|nr:PhzF family phenazine biosynthesis protein [Meiothermus sp.]GIW35542.1 MAG: phenazine biosynthesis protein PhzF [Meiothermus sp.]